MEQNKLIRLHSIIDKSCINGPGVRSVIWFQGCKHNCPGCFNEVINKESDENMVSIENIVSSLPVKDIEGVTISGGEPFLQPESLLELLKAVKREGLTVIIYTGYIYENLLALGNPFMDEVLTIADVIIDGLYKREIPSNHPWVGSGNQRVISLSEVYKSYEQMESEDLGEIIISETGEILETGFLEIL